MGSMEVPSLETFYLDELITGIHARLKSGKEATVYCCQAHPSTGESLLAAKVYRPLQFRAFKDDGVYQVGRILDVRLQRAFRKKTRAGRQEQFAGWVGSEFQTLSLLHAAGADVPNPVAASGPAILMEYVGDAESPAPELHRVSLAGDEARRVFDLIIRNVELFLACDRVHADLSPFNILYWKGDVRIIDFPQAVDLRSNPNGFSLLARDIQNVCRYFAKCGVRGDPNRVATRLWIRYLRGAL